MMLIENCFHRNTTNFDIRKIRATTSDNYPCFRKKNCRRKNCLATSYRKSCMKIQKTNRKMSQSNRLIQTNWIAWRHDRSCGFVGESAPPTNQCFRKSHHCRGKRFRKSLCCHTSQRCRETRYDMSPRCHASRGYRRIPCCRTSQRFHTNRVNDQVIQTNQHLPNLRCRQRLTQPQRLPRQYVSLKTPCEISPKLMRHAAHHILRKSSITNIP